MLPTNRVRALGSLLLLERLPAARLPKEEDVTASARSASHLPQLLDCKALQAELGVTRAAAEKIMRRLPTVHIEGLRKTYVTRAAVAAYIDSRTFAKEEVPS